MSVTGGIMGLRFVLLVASAVAVAVLTVGAFAGGIASADPYTGQTFAGASANAAKANATATIATVSGTVLQIRDSIVSRVSGL
jgi:hypothetical protein